MTLFRLAVTALFVGACGFHPSLVGGDDMGSDDAGTMGSGDAGPTINGPCGTPGAIRDDFNDGISAQMWNVVFDGTETGGVLVVTPQATNPAMQFFGYLSKHTIDLTGDAVTVEVTQMVDTASQAVGALYLVSDSKTYLSIYQRTGQLVLEQGMGVGSPAMMQIPYNPTQQRWWRIAEAGGMVTFYASPDGVVFTALPMMIPTPSWITRARIALGGSSDGNHGSVAFDNLNQDNAAVGWCKASTLVDDFNRNMIGIDWDPHVSMPSGCMPMVMNNGARFDQNGMGNSRCWLTTRQGFDLTGDHVMAYVPPLTNRPTGWSGFLRVVADNVNDAFLIQYDTPGLLCAQVQSQAEKCIQYDGTYTYWRIGESAGTLTFDASQDAATWTLVAAIPVFFTVTAVDVELGTQTTAGFTPPPANYVVDAYNKGP